MGLEVLFAMFGAIIFIGFLGELVFKKTSIPDIIWLILIGIVIGQVTELRGSPTLDLVAPIFTTFALIFVLFEGALNIKLRDLFLSMSKTTVITLLSFVLSLVVLVLLGPVFGLGILESVLVGAIIGGSSSAVVIPISEKLSVKSETVSILKLESSVSDVLCILTALTLGGILAGLTQFSLATSLNHLIGSFSIAILIGGLAGLLWIPLIKFIHKHAKSYLITIAFMLLLYSFVEYINANGAIAALAFGIVMGNSKVLGEMMNNGDTTAALTSTEKFFYSQIGFFVKAFFFVYLGILIDFSNPYPFIVAGVITLTLFFVRPLAVAPVAKNFDTKDRAALESLIPKGLAAAVLAQVIIQEPYNLTIMPGFSSMVLAVVLYTIFLSAVLVFLVERGWFQGFPALGRRLFGMPLLAGPPSKPKLETIARVKAKEEKGKILQKEKKATLTYEKTKEE